MFQEYSKITLYKNAVSGCVYVREFLVTASFFPICCEQYMSKNYIVTDLSNITLDRNNNCD